MRETKKEREREGEQKGMFTLLSFLFDDDDDGGSAKPPSPQRQ